MYINNFFQCNFNLYKLIFDIITQGLGTYCIHNMHNMEKVVLRSKQLF